MVPSDITPHCYSSGNRGRERPSRWSSAYLGDVGLEPATVCSRGNRSSAPHHWAKAPLGPWEESPGYFEFLFFIIALKISKYSNKLCGVDYLGFEHGTYGLRVWSLDHHTTTQSPWTDVLVGYCWTISLQLIKLKDTKHCQHPGTWTWNLCTESPTVGPLHHHTTHTFYYYCFVWFPFWIWNDWAESPIVGPLHYHHVGLLLFCMAPR